VLPDLTEFMWIAWLALALIFVIIELLTLEFTFLMLAGGTLIGGLGVNLLGGPWWLQVMAAAAVAALLLFTIRPLLLRALHRSSVLQPTNVDALPGMEARVVAPFTDGAGSVRLDNGETWTARLRGPGADLPVGAHVRVAAVRGATVEVIPVPESTTDTEGAQP
jgi:membrane protein implicated in regulation of membrane protease activity